MSPTARAAAAVALLAAVAVLAGTGAALAGAVVLAAAVLADALAASRTRPRADRQAPAVVVRGRAARLGVRLRGAGGERTRVRQAAVPDVDVTPREGSGGLDAELLASRRGLHVLPPVALRTRGPLGLVTRDRDGTPEAEVRAYPDVATARRLALAVRQGRFREPGRRSRGPLGLGTEFEAVRDHAPDDDLRHLNWRASARLGRPMTNTFRVEQERDVVCVLDTGRLMAAPLPGGRTRLDAALDALAAVALVADEVGDRCGCLAYGDGLRRTLTPRRGGGEAVVHALFDLEPEPVEPDHALAFRRVARMKRALVVVLTDLLDEAAARSLAAALPVLARRHVVLAAGALDPDLTARLATPPSGRREALAMAVAADLDADRRRAAAALRGGGAQVVEAPADELGARCVAAYLTAKARARL
jgi:uncharacterized protein (DUF58 family)